MSTRNYSPLHFSCKTICAQENSVPNRVVNTFPIADDSTDVDVLRKFRALLFSRKKCVAAFNCKHGPVVRIGNLEFQRTKSGLWSENKGKYQLALRPCTPISGPIKVYFDYRRGERRNRNWSRDLAVKIGVRSWFLSCQRTRPMRSFHSPRDVEWRFEMMDTFSR